MEKVTEVLCNFDCCFYPFLDVKLTGIEFNVHFPVFRSADLHFWVENDRPVYRGRRASP